MHISFQLLCRHYLQSLKPADLENSSDRTGLVAERCLLSEVVADAMGERSCELFLVVRYCVESFFLYQTLPASLFVPWRAPASPGACSDRRPMNDVQSVRF